MIRRLPSVTVVSFPTACRLSRVCALASSFWVALRSAFCSFDLRGVSVARYSATASSMLRWAYQTSRIGWVAKPAIAVR